jgi:hypothetical protein
MDVSDEARLDLSKRLQAEHLADIQHLHPRIHRDTIAIADVVTEIHWHAVDNEQIDLRMRNAERLDDILDRPAAFERGDEGRLSARRWEKIVEQTVEAN